MSEVSRLAVLGPTSEMGGAEISLLELIKGLQGRPLVSLIVPVPGPLTDAAANAGANAIVVRMPSRMNRIGEVSKNRALFAAILTIPQILFFIAVLTRRLRREKFDLLLTNGIKSHVTGTIAGRLAGVPVAWHLRDSLEERPLSRMILGILAPFATGSIAISKYVAEQMGARSARRLKPVVIYNPIDQNRFSGSASAAVDLPKPADEVWFAIIGALTPLKGQNLFLAAAFIVAERLPNSRFFVIGSSIYATQQSSDFVDGLHVQSERGTLAGKVTFLGWRGDMEHLISSMDVIVHSNQGPEGLGRVILEAMSSGKPVVAFDHGGPAEIISSGLTGELVRRGDLGALAEKMIALGSDPSECDRIGKTAQQWIRANLDSRDIAESFRNALNNFVARRE